MLFGSLDYAVLETLAAHRQLALTHIMVGLSALTAPACYIAYGLGLTAYTKGKTWMVPTISVFTAIVSTTMKRVFAFDRPELSWQVVAEHNGSFPSSHTSASVAFACGILIIYGPRWSWLFFALATMVAFSRLYLGVHWLSDICGGIAVGVLGAMVVYYSHRLVAAVRH